MPRRGPRGGVLEHHPPRHVRHAAPQLAVDEVAGPARGERERRERGEEVGDLEPAQLVLARHPPDRDEHAEKAAVERHPALPDGEDLERVLEVVAGLVEEDVAEPAARDHAEHAVEQQVVEQRDRHPPRPAGRDAASAEPVRDRETDEIHQPVPADRERADLDRDRVEVGMDEHAGEDARTWARGRADRIARQCPAPTYSLSSGRGTTGSIPSRTSPPRWSSARRASRSGGISTSAPDRRSRSAGSASRSSCR